MTDPRNCTIEELIHLYIDECGVSMHDRASRLLAHYPRLRDAALRAEMAEAELKKYKPDPEPLRIWYMRDNHTFRELTLDVEMAIAEMREELVSGNTYGMLCSHQVPNEQVHARSADRWQEFERDARTWLKRVLATIQPPAGKTEEDGHE